MKLEFKPSKKVLAVNFFQDIISIIFIILIYYCLMFFITKPTYISILKIISFCLIFLLVYHLLIITPLNLVTTKLIIDNMEIIITKGFFVKKKTIIPTSKIYFLKDFKGPIQSMMGVKIISMITIAAEIESPTLSNKDAQKLSNILMEVINEK
ncbi:PH domain-containing protein [Fructilactobacillus hinvesii]|uniref:PH domain-containing protein n=1 Tax=Fructilactobacillus hinvesii TaxID=2940300 RepID=A0ABY5BUV9_9LACO|nr:PH domain-containing protein [Fructilactobacillus hinvesii]USS88233.1 PH domain-containing protein [Fructilactobacillus hinvesii]